MLKKTWLSSSKNSNPLGFLLSELILKTFVTLHFQFGKESISILQEIVKDFEMFCRMFFKKIENSKKHR